MDKYERITVVGRGAFGTVYLCRRLRDHREVIVKQVLTTEPQHKRLNTNKFHSEIPVEQLSRLDRLATINEVKVLAMLQHPNVIEYYDNFIQVLYLRSEDDALILRSESLIYDFPHLSRTRQ